MDDEYRERSKSFLDQFNFSIFDSHYFEELNSSFWDSENIMTKKYKAKREKILKSENAQGDIESLEKAYKILLTTKTRQQYCKFLMYQYTLSQPLSMDLLIQKYYSIIFPFYLFPLKSEKEDNKYIVLDNMNFSVNYYERMSLKNSFEVDTIEDMQLNKDENSIKIKIIKTKNYILYNLLIEEHLQLFYALIIFMGLIKKKKDNWKKDLSKVNEINQNLVKETIKTIFDADENLNQKTKEFKLLTLSNDSFVPKGIKYFTYIQDKSKNSSYTNKFFVIGSSYIYLFKDQEMKDLLNIIPLVPGITMFEFNEKEKNIKIGAGLRDYNFFLENYEAWTKIQKIVLNISEGEETLFDDEDVIKVSESLYNDKIMGGELNDTPFFFKSDKDLSLLKLKFDNLSRAKIRAEEKRIIYQALQNLNNNNGFKKNENNNNNDKKEIENNNKEIEKNNNDIKEIENNYKEIEKNNNDIKEIENNNKEIENNNNDIKVIENNNKEIENNNNDIKDIENNNNIKEIEINYNKKEIENKRYSIDLQDIENNDNKEIGNNQNNNDLIEIINKNNQNNNDLIEIINNQNENNIKEIDNNQNNNEININKDNNIEIDINKDNNIEINNDKDNNIENLNKNQEKIINDNIINNVDDEDEEEEED